jgi:hypothetical protein
MDPEGKVDAMGAKDSEQSIPLHPFLGAIADCIHRGDEMTFGSPHRLNYERRDLLR